jgi:probable selenium-dependent hydroxylase accessory protein YqeC
MADTAHSGIIHLDAYIKNICTAKPSIVSVIGCGGKSSFVNHLAASFDAPAGQPVILFGSTVHTPRIINKQSGETSPFCPETFSGILSPERVVFLEADGSRGLPLKGWAAHEPVIPSETTLTVGILPVRPLGRPAHAAFIHRLPLFLEQSGAEEGKPVLPAHLARLIACPEGLFGKARGSLLLFFNQIEDGASLAAAREIYALLPLAFRSRLLGCIAGSIRQNRVSVL